jgi:endonuclease YncB( thermonuclease family)
MTARRPARRGVLMGLIGTALRLPALMTLSALTLSALTLPALMRPALGQATQGTALPSRLEGRAVDINDGDTFVLLEPSGRRWKIRIAGIDAPESRQPGGEPSRAHLQQWLQPGGVWIQPIKTDPFARVVARVFVPSRDSTEGDDEDVALKMIQSGQAWHFKRYRSYQTAQEFERFDLAERDARASGRGLWSDPDPEPPWIYRERLRASRR